ncbi:MAG: hypothetical protein JWR24_5366 [Actinoallomurus sp.]|nr:hypothetical protein [Actinoallomurus sp.]
MPGAPPVNPAVPLPGGSPPPTLPQIAPEPSPQASPSEGISELTTLAPAGAMRAGRTSWATIIAIAIVAEAGLLWLVAGLTVWRRKRVREGCVRPGRPPWLRIPKLLP